MATLKRGVLPHVYTVALPSSGGGASPRALAPESASLTLGELAAATVAAARTSPRREGPSLGNTSGLATTSSRAIVAALNPAVDPTKVILTFRGFFAESVPESPIENYRIRRVVVRFFIDDGTTDIFDPDIRNDGIIHGRFLKRTKMPGLDRDNYLEKLRVGGVVECYGRAIQLYACDEWTKKFFEDLGFPQEPDYEPPTDRYMQTHPEMFEDTSNKMWGRGSSSITRFIEAARGNHKSKKDAKLHDPRYDGVTLRFKLLWVDEYDGERTKLHYSLVYHPIEEEGEIIQIVTNERRRPPIFLKQRRLPRFVLPHDDRSHGCDDDTGDADYYNEDDLIVGNTLSVFGRDMLIYDCDDATAKWYAREKGVDQKARVVDVSDPPTPPVVHPTPPPPVFGSEEDTLNSLKSLVPKQPRKPQILEPKGFIRFLARIVTEDPVDRGRVLMVTYYRDEKEVGIYEPPMRNSGVVGGNFLRRAKLKNPATDAYYEEPDFVVGSVIKINAFSIYLVKEDTEGKRITDASLQAVLEA